MGSTAAVAAILFVSFLLYYLWERSDRTKEQAIQQVVDDLSAMGELVAASLSPQIDPDRCIGSGACVQACPEKQVIGIIGGYARLANPLGCVGHGACEAACPIHAIKLVYGTRTRGVELPRIDPHFETNQAGVYIIGELGGMGLIRNAIEQGRQAADRVVAGAPEKELPPRRGVSDALDAVIVGAGPAGISATLRLMEAGLRVLLLEREGFGGTIMHYPRAKVVMTGTLNLPIYGKVRKRTMSKEQLVELWQDIVQKTQPPLREGALVEKLSKDADGMWRVHSNLGEVRAANVLLALGVRGSPRKLDVAGEEQAKVAYRLIEPESFANKHVLVVGGGNSAVETALALADAGCCKSVRLSYRKTSFARCRGENRDRIAREIEAGRVIACLPTEVQSIGQGSVTLRDTERGIEQTVENDAVIVQVGGTPPSQLLRSFGIEIVTKYGES